MAADTSMDVYHKLKSVQSHVGLCADHVLNGLTPELAVSIREIVKGLQARLQFVRDWLDEQAR